MQSRRTVRVIVTAMLASLAGMALAGAIAPGGGGGWDAVLDKEPIAAPSPPAAPVRPAAAPSPSPSPSISAPPPEPEADEPDGTRGAWGAAGGTIMTTLSGGRIVPGPGDGDGTGSMRATVSPMKGELCYELVVQNLAQATRARIHEGGRLRTGVPVLDLAPPVRGASGGCVAVAYGLAIRMVHRPWDFYVDVATEDYPGGAIRGQVGK